MLKASEFREHARECRQLALGMELGEQRDQLLRMAAHWEEMAVDRSALVRNHPDLNEAAEGGEEGEG